MPTPYRYQEYPKWLYRVNDSRLVQNEEDEQRCRLDGWKTWAELVSPDPTPPWTVTPETAVVNEIFGKPAAPEPLIEVNPDGGTIVSSPLSAKSPKLK